MQKPGEQCYNVWKIGQNQLKNIVISYLEFLFPNLAYFGLFCHLKKEQIGQEFVIHCLISSGGGRCFPFGWPNKRHVFYDSPWYLEISVPENWQNLKLVVLKTNIIFEQNTVGNLFDHRITMIIRGWYCHDSCWSGRGGGEILEAGSGKQRERPTQAAIGRRLKNPTHDWLLDEDPPCSTRKYKRNLPCFDGPVNQSVGQRQPLRLVVVQQKILRKATRWAWTWAGRGFLLRTKMALPLCLSLVSTWR